MHEWVLVTGATAGIGRELAFLFAEKGFNVVLVARNSERLRRLAEKLQQGHSIQTLVVPQDLAEPNAAAAVFRAVGDRQISILVNNAGVGSYGDFATLPLATSRNLMQVNITAVVELTHYFVQPMIQRGHGRILNVASLAAFQPGPTVNVYYASKAFVYSFSYALADELEPKGIRVTALCPGTTQTEFFERGQIPMDRPWPLDNPRGVAQVGFRALMRGKRVAIPGLIHRVMAVVSPCLPSRWTARIVRRLHAPSAERKVKRET